MSQVKLPGSGKWLKFTMKDLAVLEADLAEDEHRLDLIQKMPFTMAPKVVQLGRAFEETITLDEAWELLEQARDAGITFPTMWGTITDALVGARHQILTIAEPGEPATDEKKADAPPGLARVS